MTADLGDIVSGSEMTKDWRHKTLSKGKFMGGASSMTNENWQRLCVEQITGKKCEKTNLRLNLDNATMMELTRPSTRDDELDWSEDFDGRIVNKKEYLYNFKMVIGTGGGQTRTIRELYHFIKCQFVFLKDNPDTEIVFINILDGDSMSAKLHRFIELKTKFSEHARIFIGDTKTYQKNWKKY